MSSIVKIENLQNMIVEIRGLRVLLDRDLATIYGVETKRINEAVKNNPDKFPDGYCFELSALEFDNLRSKISTANLTKTRVTPKAFTEKGLYMLATILKSQVATQATLGIIEAFAKLRELSRNINMNRPGNRRHPEALNFGFYRRCHEQQALPGRIQDRGGQASHGSGLPGGGCCGPNWRFPA